MENNRLSPKIKPACPFLHKAKETNQGTGIIVDALSVSTNTESRGLYH